MHFHSYCFVMFVGKRTPARMFIDTDLLVCLLLGISLCLPGLPCNKFVVSMYVNSGGTCKSKIVWFIQKNI